MDNAIKAADAVGRVGTRHAVQYRDGLIVSVLAVIPLRRGTLAALQIGRHLIKVGDHWELDIPAEDTKTRRPLDYSISEELSARIDQYLGRFRGRIRGSDKHPGLWPSHHSIPMRPDSINLSVQKRTKRVFGFGVNLHRFRHAAATFWSIYDPVQCARRQGPSRSNHLCHDREALYHGAIAHCGSRSGANDRQSQKQSDFSVNGINNVTCEGWTSSVRVGGV
jgi:integrase